LRKLIERIASENNYDNFKSAIIKNKNKNKNFIKRERSWSISSNRYEKNISTNTNSTGQVSDISAKGDSECEDIDGDKGLYKCRIKSFEPSINSINRDHFDNCLQYWQENIYSSLYKD
jgi:hypothetical protein